MRYVFILAVWHVCVLPFGLAADTVQFFACVRFCVSF